MKTVIVLFAVLLCSAVAIRAQILPAGAPRPPSLPPQPAAAAIAAPSGDELGKLMAAQTAAIRSLSARLDAIELRLADVEARTHK